MEELREQQQFKKRLLRYVNKIIIIYTDELGKGMTDTARRVIAEEAKFKFCLMSKKERIEAEKELGLR